MSLFILGLTLPFPPPPPTLTLSSAGRVLFGVNHLGLLFAACTPAALLSFSLRSGPLRRLTLGATKHAYYIPLYFLIIPGIFWTAAASLHKANGVGISTLVDSGWLFKIEGLDGRGGTIGDSWVYWKLFDFSKVELRALRSAIVNIVLVVVIGVLNLPIYVPALGVILETKVNTNHEFIGQGMANLLAGVAGTVPNIIVGLHPFSFRMQTFTLLTLTFYVVATVLLDILYACWWREIRGRRCNSNNLSVLFCSFSHATIRTYYTSIDFGTLSRYRAYYRGCLGGGKVAKFYRMAGNSGHAGRLHFSRLCPRFRCGHWDCCVELHFLKVD